VVEGRVRVWLRSGNKLAVLRHAPDLT